MRANQAAIQRRVNNPPRTIPPPGYGPNSNGNKSSQNQSSLNAAYTPYPPQQIQQQQQPQYPSQQSNIQTPSQSTAGKMPNGLNPQQQLQFILNVLGDRIAKLEMNVSDLASLDFSAASSSNSSSSMNPAVLQKEIANHPEIVSIKDTISKLQAPIPQSFSGPSPNVIDDIQTNIESIFEQLDNSDVTKIQEELQTRTELLVSEINQVKDMVLQLQNTVINVLLPAIIAPAAVVPVSTLETFTQAPLNIIQEDPSVAAAALEKNLEIAELPTITEPLTYQES
jgi:hypothetical protein